MQTVILQKYLLKDFIQFLAQKKNSQQKKAKRFLFATRNPSLLFPSLNSVWFA